MNGWMNRRQRTPSIWKSKEDVPYVDYKLCKTFLNINSRKQEVGGEMTKQQREKERETGFKMCLPLHLN